MKDIEAPTPRNSSSSSSSTALDVLIKQKSFKKRSPKLQERIIESRITHLENKDRNLYKCCLSSQKTDSRLLMYLTQVGIGGVVILFSMIMLFLDDSKCDSGSKELYISLLSGAIGSLLPSPTIRK